MNNFFINEEKFRAEEIKLWVYKKLKIKKYELKNYTEVALFYMYGI